MSVPIVITNTESLPFNSLPETQNRIQFNPPELFFFWLMSVATPSDFNVNINFPDFTFYDEYADFTDWLLEIQMAHTKFYFTETATTPFLKVENTLSYTGSLGTLNSGYYNKTVSFQFFNLNLLSEGQYFAKATFKVTALNPSTGLREVVSQKILTIEFRSYLYLLDTQSAYFEVAYKGKIYLLPSLTLSPLIFTYILGGDLPSTQDLFYFLSRLSNNTNAPAPTILNISNPLLQTTYNAIHPYFSKLLVSFSSGISTLSAGIHDFTIEIGETGSISHPSTTLTVPIQLHVLEPSTEDLIIDPSELNFEATIGGPTPSSQSFYVISDTPWQIISEVPTWLQLIYSDVDLIVTANIINYSELEPGDYSTQIVFSNGTIEATLTINFELKAFLTHPFGNHLSFTKELDFINVTSGNSDTYLEIQMEIKVFTVRNYSEVTYNRKYNLSLLNGYGVFHPGTIVDQLFEEIEKLEDIIPDRTLNYSRPAYLPAEVKITYAEKGNILNPISGAHLTTGSIPVFRMVKGHKPFITSNNLGLLSTKQQELTRITPKSVISVPFSCYGNPKIVVKKNNIITEEFIITSFPSSSGSSKVLFNYFRFNDNLIPGDTLDILLLNENEIRTSKYLVFPQGTDSTHVFYENNNGLIEVFEFTGRRKMPLNYDFTKKIVYKNLYEHSTKASTKVTQTITINAGRIMPSDYKIINEIIKSKNVWIAIDTHLNDFIKVDAISNKLTSEDTFVNDNSIDLEFNILENSYAKVYPE